MAKYYMDENGNITTEKEKKKKKKKGTNYYMDDEGNITAGKADDIAPVRSDATSRIGQTLSDAKEKLREQKEAKEAAFFSNDEKTISNSYLKKAEGEWYEKILGTAADVGENLWAGIVEAPEKIWDGMLTLGTKMNESSMMQAAQSEMMLNVIRGKEDEGVLDRYMQAQDEAERATAEYVAEDLWSGEEIAKKTVGDPLRWRGIDTEANSVLGDKSEALVQSAGQLIPSIGISMIPGVGAAYATAYTGATAFGSEAESAFNEGATFDEAVLSSTVAATAEILTEKFGGMVFGGKSFTDEMFEDFSSKVTGKLARRLLSTGKLVASGTAEGVEEFVTELATSVGKKLTYMSEKEFGEIFTKEAALDAFLGGFLFGEVFEGGKTVVTGRDSASGLTKSEQTVVDKVSEDIIKQHETDGKTLTNREKSQIQKDVLDRLEKGQIDVDTIESTLGGDKYKAYTDHVNKQKQLKDELDELRKMKSGDRNDIQNDRMNELKGMNLDDTTKRDALRKTLDDEMNQILKKNGKLVESYKERDRRGQAFEADLSEYTGKQRESVERAIKSGVLNNTYRSHELVKTLSWLEAEKGITFDYTNNAKLKESGFAVEGKTVNGYVNKSKDTITLNVQSAKAWQSVVGHEIGHVLKSGVDAQAYTELQNALYEYAQSKGELDSRRAYLTEMYKGMDADIEEELTSDLLGDYLFTDKAFINKLTGNRTLFQKIYDEVKYLCKRATGKELTEIEKVKREFDKAWEQMKVNPEGVSDADGEITYSMSGAKAKTADNSLLAKAESLLESGADSETVRQETGWYKGYDGQWRFEISDQDMNFNSRGYSTNPDVIRWRDLEYKFITDPENFTAAEEDEMRALHKALEGVKRAPSTLGDFVKHDKLFEAYPELKDIKLSFIKLDDGVLGSYKPNEKKIVVSNSIRDNKAKVEQTLVHEIQHAIQDIEGFTGGSSVGYWEAQRRDIVDTIKGARENLDLWLDDIGYSEFNKKSIQEVVDKEKTIDQHWKDLETFKKNSKYAEQIAKCEAELAKYQQRYDEITSGMTAYEQYKNTAGEIEARDVENRLSFTEEQRKNSRPDIDNPNAIVLDASGDVNGFAYVGDTKDGRRCYESGFGNEVSVDERINEFKKRIATIFNLGAVELKTDVKKIQVRGDKFTVKENLYGDKMGQDGEKEAKVNSLYDLADILATSKYDPSGTAKEPSYENPSAEPKNAAHKGVKYWYKFKNEIVFDGVPYTVTFNIRDKGAEQYQYLIDFKENKTPNLSTTAVKSLLQADRVSFDNSISPLPENVNTNFSLSPETDSDYKSAVERGDTETAQKMVDEAAKSAGYGIKAYHGTGYDFTVFDKSKQGDNYQDWGRLGKGFYFAPTSREAETWAELSKGAKNKVMPVYLRSENMLDSFEALPDDLKDAIPAEWEGLTRRLAEKYAYNFIEYMQEFGYNVQEILMEKGYDGINGHTEFVVFNPEQVKSADTVTYDDKGNVIPLSERFNTANEDIRYSISNKGERSAPVGNYSTPLRELALEGDVAPVVTDTNVGDTTTTEVPFPDEIAPMTEDEANAIQDAKAKADAAAEGLPKTRKQLHNNIINDVKATFSSMGYDFDDVLEKAKNLSTFSTVDNTPQRVMEKALGYKEGQTLADLTVNKVAQNESKGIKWLNSFTDRKNGLLAQISKQYRIKPGSKESAAAQMYAEGFYVNDNNDIIAYGDAELAQDFPDVGTQYRIKGLASDPRIRQIYDETLDAINKSRARNAYPEIQRLDNYFLHFRAMDDTFSRLGLPFNPNDIRAKDLPTDLNGVTADLKPGQPYFASAMHRTGKRTSFDLLGGLERYLTSAKNQIYHIDDIQTLRALRNYIADTYGQANGLEGIDALSEEEAQERIEQVYNSHLSTFAKFLNEEANVLAGKTALIDRGLEGFIGRRGMTFLDTVNRQVGSNMVGFNLSSSMTNFLSVAQGVAKTNKFDFLKAFTQTVSNKVGSVFGKSDGFTENSPVVIRRKGADRFYRTPYQKAGDAGYVLMSAVDNISTELIARTKFNELTRKGMDEQKAHFETDKWVSRLMGDRSLGQQPQLYNSKTLGVLTKFQLEVRNQLDSQFYDTIQEAKVSNEDIKNALARNAKTAAKVTSTFVQLAVAQHLFGKAFESVAGYNPAFDIISVLSTMFGFDDDEESEDTVLDNIEQGFLELLEDLPYTSTLTGGRIPLANALPVTELIKGVDSYGNEKSRWETLGEAAPYYVLPGGYSQIKKTAQGLNMFSDEHPVSGSYTDSGNLRFPVEDTLGNRVQAALFGQYASENAREYFDNGYAPLKEKQIQEYIDVDMPIKDYWEYREGLKKQETLEDKFDYIAGLDLPVSKKNILINNVVDREEPVDLENYYDFGSLEEFDFAAKNPEKYSFAKSVGGYSAYKTYSSELYDIKADKDASGKSITGSRKAKVIDYINNLDADYYTKIILYKSEYPSDDSYNADIVNYIVNHSDLTYDDRVAILTELGFRVAANGDIYAD